MVAQRLGKNIGGYHGETIDVAAVLRECEAAAALHQWSAETFWNLSTHRWLAFRRRVARPSRRIYLSTGIHGDEPAGPLSALELMRHDGWPAGLEVWLCPCLNPTGFALERRENADGIDLNRQYLHFEAPETQAHAAWLQRQPNFDLTLCLHEDWESHGFYLYELNPDQRPSLAEEMIRRVGAVCPIDPSPLIEGREARGGVIRPSTDPRSRPEWPEAFYLLTHKTKLSYTLEAPSDFPLNVRVAALVAAVRAVLETME